MEKDDDFLKDFEVIGDDNNNLENNKKNIFSDFEEVDNNGNVINNPTKNINEILNDFEEVDESGNVVSNKQNNQNLAEQVEVVFPTFTYDYKDPNNYLEDKDFLFFINVFYSKNIINKFERKHFVYASNIYTKANELVKVGKYQSREKAIIAALKTPQVEETLTKFEAEREAQIEKDKEIQRAKRELEKEEEKIIEGYGKHKDKMYNAMSRLGDYRIKRPFDEFYSFGFSKLKDNELTIENELKSDNRDISKFIISDYKLLLDATSVKEYVKNYIRFFACVTQAKHIRTLTEAEVRDAYHKSCKEISKTIPYKVYNFDIKYDDELQKKIDDKSYLKNISNKDRLNYIKELKESILSDLDKKYEVKYDKLLLNMRQRFELCKKLVYSQSTINKIMHYGYFAKERNELIDLTDRLSHSLHMKKDDLFKKIDDEGTLYSVFVEESRDLYRDPLNEANGLVDELKKENLFKTELNLDASLLNESNILVQSEEEVLDLDKSFLKDDEDELDKEQIDNKI